MTSHSPTQVVRIWRVPELIKFNCTIEINTHTHSHTCSAIQPGKGYLS